MLNRLRQKFTEKYGVGGDIRTYFAPGRVNLIGEHTDYNGGHVFPCALTLGTYGMARKRTDDKIRFYSVNFERAGVVTTSLSDLIPSDKAGWTNYPKGVMWAFEKRGFKMDTGVDFMIYGNIPNGSGLSSSASLEVLTGVMLRDLYGFDSLTNQDLAQIGQYSENNFNGMNCGIMDQFASAMGKEDCAIFLDTNSMEYEYAPVNLPDAKIVITNSKVKHSLVSSAYNDRRNECETALKDLQSQLSIRSLGELTEEAFEANKGLIKSDVCRNRAKHAVYGNQRTDRAVEALKANDIEKFGELMNASHDSLRDDYEVSCAEIDKLVDYARAIPGVLGSRITGGGFGGCTVSIVKNDAVDTFVKEVGEKYAKEVGHNAEFYVVDIGKGAGCL
ncbi:MAG: galactokinase [Clostridiales bacterium]|nr:galactokinase [Candidatus Blautia equi]